MVVALAVEDVVVRDDGATGVVVILCVVEELEVVVGRPRVLELLDVVVVRGGVVVLELVVVRAGSVLDVVVVLRVVLELVVVVRRGVVELEVVVSAGVVLVDKVVRRVVVVVYISGQKVAIQSHRCSMLARGLCGSRNIFIAYGLPSWSELSSMKATLV